MFEKFVSAARGAGISGVAVDDAGNVVVVGFTWGRSNEVDGVDDQTDRDASGHDVFVIKYDRFGNRLWGKRFGDAARQGAYDVGIDASGRIYVTGAFHGVLTIGNTALVGTMSTELTESDAFLFALAADGTPLWAKAFGGQGLQRGVRMAVNRVGTIALGGDFLGTLDLGGGALVSRATSGPNDGLGPRDIFVAAFDAQGLHLHSHALTSTTSARGGGIGIDDAGNIGVGGTYVAPLRIGQNELPSRTTGATRGFVGKFGADGAFRWANALGQGDEGTTSVSALVLTRNGRTLATGQFTGALSFGGVTHQSGTTSPPSLFFTRLSP
jgi:hypothetical protein